jgi:hypothetical protein
MYDRINLCRSFKKIYTSFLSLSFFCVESKLRYGKYAECTLQFLFDGLSSEPLNLVKQRFFMSLDRKHIFGTYMNNF